MKLAYFHLLTADNDDVALGDAKTLGHVPTTCLLGGHIVWKHIALNLDPCAGCNGPRPRCGGRPKVDGREDAFARIATEYRSALLLVRR